MPSYSEYKDLFLGLDSFGQPSRGQEKSNNISSISEIKKQLLGDSTLTKKQTLDPNYFPESEEEYLQMYPQATTDTLDAYRRTKVNKDYQKMLEQGIDINKEISERGRTAGETAGDIASGLSKFAIETEGMAYGLGDIISRPLLKANKALVDTVDKFVPDFMKTGIEAPLPESLDEATGGYSKEFRKSVEHIDKNWLSEPTKAAKEVVNAKALIRELQGKTPNTIGGQLKESGETIADYVDNPLALLDATITSAPNMFIAGGIGKVVTNKLAKELTGEQATSFLTKSVAEKMSYSQAQNFLNSAAGKELVKKTATTAGVTTTGVMEGLSNGMEIKGEILSTPFDKLEKTSPEYNKLIKSGLSPEEARMKLSTKAFDLVTTVAGITGAVAGKVSGAGKLEGNLFNPDSFLGKNLLTAVSSKIVQGATKEFLEEYSQGATGKLAKNIATKEYVDPTQEILKGVGQEAGAGAISGALSGATVIPATAAIGIGKSVAKGAVEVAKATPDAIKATAETIATTIKETPETIQKVKESVSESKRILNAVKDPTQATELLDDTKDNYKATTAVDYLTQSTVVPKTTAPQEEKEQYAKDLKKHLLNIFDELSNKPVTNEKELEDVKKAKDLYVKYTKRVNDYIQKSKLSDQDFNDLVKDITDTKNKQEEVQDSVDRVFNSIRAGGTAPTQKNITAYESLVQAKNINKSQQAEVSGEIEFNNAVTQGEIIADELPKYSTTDKTKNPLQVHKDIFEGNQEDAFLGLNNYREAAKAALLDKENKSKNVPRLKKILSSLEKFGINQARKVKLVNEAYAIAKSDKNYGKNPRYKEIEKQLSDEFKMRIHSKTPQSLVNLMNTDYKAIKATYKQISAGLKNVYNESSKDTETVLPNTETTTPTSTSTTSAKDVVIPTEDNIEPIQEYGSDVTITEEPPTYLDEETTTPTISRLNKVKQILDKRVAEGTTYTQKEFEDKINSISNLTTSDKANLVKNYTDKLVKKEEPKQEQTIEPTQEFNEDSLKDISLRQSVEIEYDTVNKKGESITKTGTTKNALSVYQFLKERWDNLQKLEENCK